MEEIQNQNEMRDQDFQKEEDINFVFATIERYFETKGCKASDEISQTDFHELWIYKSGYREKVQEIYGEIFIKVQAEKSKILVYDFINELLRIINEKLEDIEEAVQFKVEIMEQLMKSQRMKQQIAFQINSQKALINQDFVLGSSLQNQQQDFDLVNQQNLLKVIVRQFQMLPQNRIYFCQIVLDEIELKSTDEIQGAGQSEVIKIENPQSLI